MVFIDGMVASPSAYVSLTPEMIARIAEVA
jgi:hypothetical protein